jgi:hypothetical protein
VFYQAQHPFERLWERAAEEIGPPPKVALVYPCATQYPPILECRARININEDYEVRYWTLGVTEQRLSDAVNAVGTSAKKVREQLKSDWHAGRSVGVQHERGTKVGMANGRAIQ